MATLPLGRWQGRALADVPRDYLLWLARRRWLRDELREAVHDEIARRPAARTASDETEREYRLEALRHLVAVATGTERDMRQRALDELRRGLPAQERAA